MTINILRLWICLQPTTYSVLQKSELWNTHRSTLLQHNVPPVDVMVGDIITMLPQEFFLNNFYLGHAMTGCSITNKLTLEEGGECGHEQAPAAVCGPCPWLAPLPWPPTPCSLLLSSPPFLQPCQHNTLPVEEVHTIHQTLPHSWLSCTSCVWNIFPTSFKIKEINKACNVTEEKANTCQQLRTNMQAL